MVAFKDRVGELHNTLQGDCIIIKYNNCNDLWVEFQDEHKAKVHCKYKDLKNNIIKNPYFPCVCKIAYIGQPKKDFSEREYKTWNIMIHRCYDSNFHKDHPTYKDATVCKRWLCFEYFLDDLPLIEGYNYWLEHPNERIALDKDIKGNGSKVYCLENCKFISNIDNIKESRNRNGSVGFCSEPKPVVGVNKITGEVIRFESAREAQRQTGISQSQIGHCCRKEPKYKSAKGYYWYFEEDYNKMLKDNE